MCRWVRFWRALKGQPGAEQGGGWGLWLQGEVQAWLVPLSAPEATEDQTRSTPVLVATPEDGPHFLMTRHQLEWHLHLLNACKVQLQGYMFLTFVFKVTFCFTF